MGRRSKGFFAVAEDLARALASTPPDPYSIIRKVSLGVAGPDFLEVTKDVADNRESLAEVAKTPFVVVAGYVALPRLSDCV